MTHASYPPSNPSLPFLPLPPLSPYISFFSLSKKKRLQVTHPDTSVSENEVAWKLVTTPEDIPPGMIYSPGRIPLPNSSIRLSENLLATHNPYERISCRHPSDTLWKAKFVLKSNTSTQCTNLVQLIQPPDLVLSISRQTVCCITQNTNVNYKLAHGAFINDVTTTMMVSGTWTNIAPSTLCWGNLKTQFYFYSQA